MSQEAARRYADGHCTQYAHARRPDLPVELGHGRTWAERAASMGYRVDDIPRPGAIGVFPAWTRGACHNGHVAYVEAVLADGRVVVSEMNWTAPHRVNHRVIRADGLLFVHRPSA